MIHWAATRPWPAVSAMTTSNARSGKPANRAAANPAMAGPLSAPPLLGSSYVPSGAKVSRIACGSRRFHASKYRCAAASGDWSSATAMLSALPRASKCCLPASPAAVPGHLEASLGSRGPLSSIRGGPSPLAAQPLRQRHEVLRHDVEARVRADVVVGVRAPLQWTRDE